MATVERKKTSRKTDPPQPLPEPRRSRFRLLLLAMLVGCGSLVAALPTLVTCGPWRNTLIALCLADLNGKVSTGSLSVGWFTPLSASDIRVVDAQHQAVVTIATATTNKSLLGLLAGLDDLGTITIDGLDAKLVLREDGSNVEDLLAHWRQSPPSGSTPNIRFDLHLTDGQVVVQDLSSHQQCTLGQLAVHAAGSTDLTQPLDATIEATLQHDGRSGPLAIKIASQPSDASEHNTPGAGTLAIKVQEFPLAVCQAVVCRQLPRTRLAGALSVDLNCQAAANERGHLKRSANGQVAIAGLALGGPWLSGDSLTIQQLTIPCQAVLEENRLDVRRLDVTSDVGQVKVQGTLAAADQAIAVQSIADLVRALNGSSANVSGNLDLAKLSQLLPHAAGLKSGVQLTAGSLAWQISGKDAGGQPSYSGSLDASNIEAQAGGRQLTWKSPLHASFSAHGEGRTAVLDQLQCQADFLQLTAQGNIDTLSASGKYDLGQLCDQLGQFIELGPRRVDGQGAFSANYQRATSGSFTAAAKFNVEELQISLAGNPWSDQPGAFTAQLKGQWPSGNTWRVDSAAMTGQIGSDQVSLTLAQAVSGPWADSKFPLALHVSGQAGTWLSRMQAIGGVLPGVAAAGQIDLRASATCSPTMVVVDSAVLTSQPLELRSGQATFEEPEVRIEAAGRIELTSSHASDWNIQLQTTSFSTDLAEGTFGWAAGQQTASGSVAFAGDLARMQNSVGLAGRGFNLAGTVNGKGTLRQSGSQSALEITANVDNLIVGAAPGQAMAFGKVDLSVAGDYDAAPDTLKMTACNFSSSLAKFEASGTIQTARANPTIDLSGHCEYDLETITALLQTKFGPNIQLTGRESRSFRLQGPLVGGAEQQAASATPVSAASLLSGQASLGWDAASIYGFNLGPATLDAQLDHGALQLTPAQLSVNGGRVNLGGQVQPLSAAGMFTLPPGLLVDHVQISEKLGHPSLKFILPMASHSEVQGEVSVAITNCQLPLANPGAGDVSGQLTIHQLQMSRGPFMQELAGLLKRNEAAQLANNSVVPFRLVQGRIYHEGLELKLREITVRTYGSVGLDQSLAIMAELPVPLSWLPEGLSTGQFKDKTIRVPIGGTLNKPQVDHKEVEQLARNFVHNATENVLRNGIAKPLERLLGPRETDQGN